jgi:hypothetical protein
MKRNIIVQIFIAFVFLSCINAQETKNDDKPQVKTIDDIYVNMSINKDLIYRKIKGQFTNIETIKSSGKYVANFILKEIKPPINYITYPEDKKDKVVFGNQVFNIVNKLDPSSLIVYWVFKNDEKYLCFIGKAQSASGSGVQVSYFTLLQLNNVGRAVHCNEFQSRFGNINSLVDYNKNGSLNYYKIVNGKKMGQYLLTVNDIKSNTQVDKRSVLLKYELNDKFTILEDSRQ